MSYTDLDRLTAFAGVYQSAYCVRQIARQGTVDTRIMDPCIHSLFQIDTPNVAAAFGPPGAVASGARQIVAQLTAGSNSGPPRDQELLRYVVTLVKLERALSGRRDMLEAIRAGIEAIAAGRGDRPLLDPSLLASPGHYLQRHPEPPLAPYHGPRRAPAPQQPGQPEPHPRRAARRCARRHALASGRRASLADPARPAAAPESARGYLASAVLG